MGEYDRSSKWLIQHHGDSILRLAGLRDVLSWRSLQAELVQPSKLPDGMLEARLPGHDEDDLFVLEISTYADRRVYEQIVRDMALVYLDRGKLPEVLTVVLRPKGNLQVEDSIEVQSPVGWTRWHSSWRVVELWKIPADDLLALGDPGLIPWVPLASFDGPPETILRECRKRIDGSAASAEHDNLLAVTQILSKLRYDDPNLLTILGGRDIMIESPLIKELVAEAQAKMIVAILHNRFGDVPE